MKVEKTKLNKAIEQMKSEYSGLSGVKPDLFRDDIKESFINAVIRRGDDASEIIRLMKEDGFEMTYRKIYLYLTKLFGPYTKRGRPSIYVSNGNERQVEKGYYRN